VVFVEQAYAPPSEIKIKVLTDFMALDVTLGAR